MAATPEISNRDLKPAIAGSSSPRLSGRLEKCLWVFALATLGLAAWMKADALLYQRWAREVPFAGQDASTAPEAPAGFPIATIEIPRLNLSVVVAEGIEQRTLLHAVGRLPWSARPGETGNVVLAGHRDTFFRPLENIRLGDQILLESASGRATYSVVWIDIVGPADVRVTAQTDYPALTLITCYPFRYVGSAPHRFVVRARRSDSPIEEARARSAPALSTG